MLKHALHLCIRSFTITKKTEISDRPEFLKFLKIFITSPSFLADLPHILYMQSSTFLSLLLLKRVMIFSQNIHRHSDLTLRASGREVCVFSSLVKNIHLRNRSKHNTLRFSFAQILNQLGQIKSVDVASMNQHADIGTKATGQTIFDRHVPVWFVEVLPTNS